MMSLHETYAASPSLLNLMPPEITKSELPSDKLCLASCLKWLTEQAGQHYGMCEHGSTKGMK